jgi:hypothetical protein
VKTKLDSMFTWLRFEAEFLKGRLPDKMAMWVAWALPKRVVMWSYIRVVAHATTGPHGMTHPDEVTYSMALKRWKVPHPVPDDPLDHGYLHGSAFKPIAVPDGHH